MLLLFSFVVALAAIGIISFYIWYLTWPVVQGKVAMVNEGVTSVSQIRSPRPYRLLVFKFEHAKGSYTSMRQGLIVTSALPPRKMKGDTLPISVCCANISWSCPYRPIKEFFSVLGLLAIIVSPLAILYFLY